MHVVHVIRREFDVERQLCDGVGERGVAHAGLDVGDAVVEVDLEDVVHACRRDDHAVLERDAPAGQSGAGAARDDLHVALGQERDDLHDLLGERREDDGARRGAGDGEAVAVVDEQLRRVGDDALRRGDRFRVRSMSEGACCGGHVAMIVLRDRFATQYAAYFQKGQLMAEEMQNQGQQPTGPGDRAGRAGAARRARASHVLRQRLPHPHVGRGSRHRPRLQHAQPESQPAGRRSSCCSR